MAWGVGVVAAAAGAFVTTFITEKLLERFLWRFWEQTFNRFDLGNARRPFGNLQDRDTTRILQDLKDNQWRMLQFFDNTFGGMGSLIGGGLALCALGATHSPLMAGLLGVAILPRMAFDFAGSHLHDAFERRQTERGRIMEARRNHLSGNETNRDLQVSHAIPWAFEAVKEARASAMGRRFRFVDATYRRRMLAALPLVAGGVATLYMASAEAAAGILPATALPGCIGATVAAVAAGLSLSNSWGSLVQQHGYVRRILRFLNAQNEPAHDSALPACPDTASPEAPHISVKNLTVQKEGEAKPRLKNVSVEFPPGGFIGIVGARGAGKTTLLKTLLKEIEPSSGGVYILGADGEVQELSDLSPSDWHLNINCLYQDAPDFNGLKTREAIMLGRKVPKEHLYKVMEVSGLLEVAAGGLVSEIEKEELEERVQKLLSQRIGERYQNGRDFSGGEKRIIAVTRALLQPHPVVILDEPGEGLDPESELRMLTRIRDFCREAGRTLIVVSHRYGTLIGADEILVMKGGEIEDRGTHADLLRAERTLEGEILESTYRTAYRAQLESLLPGFEVQISDEGLVSFTAKQ